MCFKLGCFGSAPRSRRWIFTIHWLEETEIHLMYKDWKDSATFGDADSEIPLILWGVVHIDMMFLSPDENGTKLFFFLIWLSGSIGKCSKDSDWCLIPFATKSFVLTNSDGLHPLSRNFAPKISLQKTWRFGSPWVLFNIYTYIYIYQTPPPYACWKVCLQMFSKHYRVNVKVQKEASTSGWVIGISWVVFLFPSRPTFATGQDVQKLVASDL